VLFISEVNLSAPGYVLLAQKVMEGLQQKSGYQIEFFTESLSSTSFASAAKEKENEEAIVREFENTKLDLIVAFGPTPIKFLSEVQDTFLPRVPIVVCGSTRDQAGNPRLGNRFTGAWFQLDPAATMQLAPQLIPGLKHVFVVGGSSSYDTVTLKIVHDDLVQFEGKYDIQYLTQMTLAQVLAKLGKLPEHSIVLYTSFFQDAAGQQFINATVALPTIAAASSAPLWGLSDTYIGHGIVGGNVVRFSEQGELIARLGQELLQGKKAKDIPISVSSNSNMFDYRELKRWGISERSCPYGSVIVNRDQTLWDQDPGTVITAFSIMIGLGVISIYLLRERRLLRKATNNLANLTGQLINAQEEERRRLARELHDDFSQRVALLCLGLEIAADEVSRSPEDAKVQLRQLMDSAGEIGADLHAVSHRLHSATLERLGLVAGVSALCKEYNKKQGIAVEFANHDVPRSIPTDVALCVFRIVQESLRNVKKHSGSVKAWVDLRYSRNKLYLSVLDEGCGFEGKMPGYDQGIGIQSMKERVRLMDGTFEITSKVGEGTRVAVILTVRQQPPSAEPIAIVPKVAPIDQIVRQVSHG
jgi:signal transduction histidine kinase